MDSFVGIAVLLAAVFVVPMAIGLILKLLDVRRGKTVDDEV